ncbi:methyltransferase family protein [Luteimonas aestuarii]|nr:isoprenylcysteine carboxylmethyltransferase family protein [Luteimonas aestuarii]
MASDRAALRAPLLVRSTSPLHCLLAFAAGAGLQQALGLPLPQGVAREAMQAIGTGLANAGLVLVLWCFVLFARARTTLLPGDAPARLILHGPFRWSRNPIYVGMLASYIGLALMLDVPWALATLAVPVLVLQRSIVPWEEGRLHARFPREYADYARRVRRWL